MNLPIDPSPLDPPATTPRRPRRPWWFWLLLLLPPTIAVVPVVIDWAVYRSGGGGDGTHGLASGITFGLAGLVVGLFTGVVLAGWEARNRSGRTPAAVVAIGTFIGVQALNLGLTLAGCTIGLRAVDSMIR